MPDILEYCKGRKVETFKSGVVLISEGGDDRKVLARGAGDRALQLSRRHETATFQVPGGDKQPPRPRGHDGQGGNNSGRLPLSPSARTSDAW